MILFDDGTLQLFDRPDCEPADVSMEEDDDEEDEDEELVRRGPACVQFESLSVVPQPRVVFAGDLASSKPSTDLREGCERRRTSIWWARQTAARYSYPSIRRTSKSEVH